MKKKKNAFTLIELLAIIVILAIIAVITVPIILNIIENSRRGAATDSAYGFKDAVNKYYVTELSGNHELTLQGLYTVSTGGVLNGSGIDGIAIPVSGEKPSAGELHYTNNTLQGGCIVIGDYAVTFNNDGTTNTEKGDCSGYVYIPTMAEMCPDCVYGNVSASIGGSAPEGTSNSYTALGNRFLGYIVESGNVTRAFACGIENGTPFCLEGYDESKYSVEANIGVLNAIFPSCNASASDSDAYCDGSSVHANAYDDGYVGVGDGHGDCYVNDIGNVSCNG